MNADDLPLSVAWFPTAMPDGPAIGDPEHTTWSSFCGFFWFRREGPKDGICFIPATFKPEPDGRVRRLGANVLQRTAIVLDVEANKKSGEKPPPLHWVTANIERSKQTAVVYTSHNHTAWDPRYRIVMPVSEPLDPELPAPEVLAANIQIGGESGKLQSLLGVLDRSKLSAASLFYLPSADHDHDPDQHQCVVIPGHPLDAAWMRQEASKLLAQRKAEEDRVAAQAHAEAVARRDAKIAAGFNPDDSLIEKLRPHLDLAALLVSHGYDRKGTKYRHPNSQSGRHGADVKTLSGIQRVFSHNANDPLHASNLPAWCGVKAIDAFDVVCILDFNGDRTRALRELAQRFKITKTDERRTLARLIFHLIHQQAPQETIEASAFAEGIRLGLARPEVIDVANWCVRKLEDAA